MVWNIIMLWDPCLVEKFELIGEGLMQDMDFELKLQGQVGFLVRVGGERMSLEREEIVSMKQE